MNADMVTQCLVAEELAAGDIAAAYFFRHYWRFARLVPGCPGRRELIVRGIAEDEKFVPASASTEPQAGRTTRCLLTPPVMGRCSAHGSTLVTGFSTATSS